MHIIKVNKQQENRNNDHSLDWLPTKIRLLVWAHYTPTERSSLKSIVTGSGSQIPTDGQHKLKSLAQILQIPKHTTKLPTLLHNNTADVFIGTQQTNIILFIHFTATLQRSILVPNTTKTTGWRDENGHPTSIFFIQ